MACSINRCRQPAVMAVVQLHGCTTPARQACARPLAPSGALCSSPCVRLPLEPYLSMWACQLDWPAMPACRASAPQKSPKLLHADNPPSLWLIIHRPVRCLSYRVTCCSYQGCCHTNCPPQCPSMTMMQGQGQTCRSSEQDVVQGPRGAAHAAARSAALGCQACCIRHGSERAPAQALQEGVCAALHRAAAVPIPHPAPTGRLLHSRS